MKSTRKKNYTTLVLLSWDCLFLFTGRDTGLAQNPSRFDIPHGICLCAIVVLFGEKVNMLIIQQQQPKPESVPVEALSVATVLRYFMIKSCFSCLLLLHPIPQLSLSFMFSLNKWCWWWWSTSKFSLLILCQWRQTLMFWVCHFLVY